MPKVVIELQANTQQAVQQIQAFAKAQRDAFDAIRAGNPALQDAVVKVSKLTETTKQSALVTGDLNRAAQSLARGGIRELASQVPIVGEALANLAGTLKGFPGVLLSVVGAGVGVIAWLKSLQDEATKATERMGALGVAMQQHLRRTQLEVAQGRATGAGDVARGLSLGAAGDIAAAEEARDRAKAAARQAAKAAQPGIFSPEEFAAVGLGITGPLAAKQSLIASELRQKEEQANEAYALTVFKIQERLKTELTKLEADYDQTLGESQEKRVQSAARAAEQQQKITEDLVAASLRTFRGLGAGFEDVVQSLELSRFVTESQAKIAELNAGIAAGIDTHGRFAEGVAALQTKMDEAIRLGYVPTIEKAKQLGDAITEAAEDAEDAGQQWLRSMEGISASMDEIIAKTRAAGSGGAVTGGSVMAGAGASAGPTGGGVVDTSGLLRTIEMIGGSFQHGGIVPGSGPVPIVAHGGERILPAGARGGDGAVLVRIEPGAVQVHGTVIDQSRSWGVLVEELGQALEARLRR